MKRIIIFGSMIVLMVIMAIMYAPIRPGIVPIAALYFVAFLLTLRWQINGKREKQKMASCVFLTASLFLLIGVFGAMETTTDPIIGVLPLLIFAGAALVASMLLIPDNIKPEETFL